MPLLLCNNLYTKGRSVLFYGYRACTFDETSILLEPAMFGMFGMFAVRRRSSSYSSYYLRLQLVM
jgi:hypothetical protein